MAWWAIPKFLEMFPQGKCIFILRDPRDVLCSFKRMTTNPSPGYMDAIFASLGAFQQASNLSEHLPESSLFVIRYEDFVSNPESFCKNLCEFLEVTYDERMLDISRYKDVDGQSWVSNTSYSEPINKITSGSIGRWQKNILPEELYILEMVLKDEMVRYNYPLSGQLFSIDDSIKSFELLRHSEVLSQRFERWLRKKKGIDTYPNNPSWQPQTVDE